MKEKKNLLFVVAVLLISILLILVLNFVFGGKSSYATDFVKIRSVETEILADGKIASENEANLHFPTSGKLAKVNIKEGDLVNQGQTIASLDTYALQRQLTASLNNYRNTRDTFDQAQQNTNNGVAAGQQRYSLEVTNKVGLSGQNETDIVNDMIKRILDQNQANLDNSVINVELANYALQLSSLTAPFSGTIIHEDVDEPGTNITPSASFVLIDPQSLVFRAQVNEQDIGYVAVGSEATVRINGVTKKLLGHVGKIYPEKITLANGQNIYNIDISGLDVKNLQYAQSGTVMIKSNTPSNTRLIPRWTLLNGQQVWVKEGGNVVLKKVEIGKTHGKDIEVLDGLDSSDQLIVNPQLIVQNKYSIL